MVENYQNFGPFAAAEVRMKTVSPITVVARGDPPPNVALDLSDEINQPNEEIAFTGYIIIRRGNPVHRADGRWEIPQMIQEADTVGYSQLLRSRVQIIQDPQMASVGKTIQKTAGIDFPADSYFNVHFVFRALDVPEFPELRNSSRINVARAG